jgi:glycine betaine transporter
VLLLSGGLDGLQTAAIVAAAPFTIIMVLMCYSLFTALASEKTEDGPGIPARPKAPE